MTRSTISRLIAVTGISIFALTSYACSSSTSSLDNGASGDSDSALQIYFPTMYSAFDGTHTFEIPAYISGVTKVTWSASDPSMVDIDATDDGNAMITVRKAGTVTINAKAGSLTGAATLTITQSDSDTWQAGSERYNDGVVLTRPAKGQDAGPMMSPTANKQLACTNCHGSGGSGQFLDVEHTPTQTGGYSDQDLITIFTKGQKPPGVPQRVMPLAKWSAMHQWQMDDFAVQGIVTYLRSLEPKSQGIIDFGGHGPQGNGGGGSSSSSSSSSGSSGDPTSSSSSDAGSSADAGT